ncbi:hypothetical protein GP486_005056 [Trichoglossum hirsutum]|uniref:Uncharacterized protein n=1 Tax=Trichoglossum hirsutum TaxID=265104 RepID=A0A9P8RMZ2_9PEZI|nr:hypothetical protein GP486_005056 [Trichoglossum hirsutum]
MRILLAAMDARRLTFENEENEQNRHLISWDRIIVPGERLPAEYLAPFRSLWADGSIQKTAQRANELALHDNVY